MPSTSSYRPAMAAPAFDLALFAAMLQAYEQAGDSELAVRWLLLETAHVVGQAHWRPHTRVHRLMLTLAWRSGQWSEVIGQCTRLALVPLGHMLGRLPVGNPGSTRVGAFRSVPITPDMAKLLATMRAELRAAPSEVESV